MDFVRLIVALATFAPLVNYVGYDSTGNISRYVDFTISRNIQFTVSIKTNGVFRLQIAQDLNGGWEAFGPLIIGPSESTHTLPVPSGEGYFSVRQIQ